MFTAEEIRAAREARGWSQQKLAQQLGVAVSTVGRWERGETRPVGLAARALDVLFAVPASEPPEASAG